MDLTRKKGNTKERRHEGKEKKATARLEVSAARLVVNSVLILGLVLYLDSGFRVVNKS